MGSRNKDEQIVGHGEQQNQLWNIYLMNTMYVYGRLYNRSNPGRNCPIIWKSQFYLRVNMQVRMSHKSTNLTS